MVRRLGPLGLGHLGRGRGYSEGEGGARGREGRAMWVQSQWEEARPSWFADRKGRDQTRKGSGQ